MRYQLWPAVVTIPRFTAASSPLVQPWTLTQGHLERIFIDTPSGHKGQTGLAIYYMGTPVIPWAANSWLVMENQSKEILWHDEIMEQGFTIKAYNTGNAAHSFWLYAEIWPTVAPANAVVEGTGTVAHRRATTKAKVARLERRKPDHDLQP